MRRMGSIALTVSLEERAGSDTAPDSSRATQPPLRASSQPRPCLPAPPTPTLPHSHTMTGSSKKKHGLVSAAGGLKKQKLSSMSRDLKEQTKKSRAISAAVHAKDKALSEKKRGLRESSAKCPYNPHMQYLLVGEGNFSFTRALVANFKQRLQREAERAPAPATVDAAAVAAARKEEEQDDPKRGPLSASAAKKFRRKEGVFDPALHTPFLSPGSPFTNPELRVVATSYDSFKELCFKYEEVAGVLADLAREGIPVWTSVDATKLERAQRARKVTEEMIAAAQKQESERKEENAAARRARRQKEEEDDAAGIDATVKLEDDDDDEDEAEAEESKMETEAVDPSLFSNPDPEIASLLHPKISPLLFPPFITRRALHSLQNEAEAKLHGSQRKKLKEKRAAEAEEMRGEVAQAASTEAASSSSSAAASASAAAPAAPAPRGPNSATLKTLARNALTTHSLSVLNPSPRVRFHRILFQFPHTGCGIKDTEQNNQVHRELLLGFLRNVVANRLVYPSTHHGEIHITLKKGEPYRSGWNLVALARQVQGLAFKTSVEFYPQLYPGYEHRRTRGFDGERTLDLSTGATLGPNSDIAFSAGKAGAMTYIFTREPTAMDEEESRFDTEWIGRYNVAKQAEDTRTGLLAECEKIYKDTMARAAAQQSVQHQQHQQHQQQQQSQQQSDVPRSNVAVAHKKRRGESGVKLEEFEPVVKREEIDEEEEEAHAESAEEEEADEEQHDAHEDSAMDPATARSDDDDDDDTAAAAAPPSLSLAAQLRQHFQPRAAALATSKPAPKPSKPHHAAGSKLKSAGQKRKHR